MHFKLNVKYLLCRLYKKTGNNFNILPEKASLPASNGQHDRKVQEGQSHTRNVSGGFSRREHHLRERFHCLFVFH